MKILVINAGSSSLKYQIIDMPSETTLCKGLVEKIGQDNSNLEQNGKKIIENKPIKNHTEALNAVIKAIVDGGVIKDISEIDAVGHRMLHGGEYFKDSAIIDSEVMEKCKQNIDLGPLHMPANIACVESCHELMPGIPMVAVFDTVFHQTMPKYSYMYAIPYSDYENYKIRKYGFHGTSHKYVTSEAIRIMGTEKCRIINCHLGNGSSISAVKDGKCVDTSMGLTPLEGLIMGTRSGDLDPAVVEFMAKFKGIDVETVLNILNKKSGFLGLTGMSDFRDICKKKNSGDEQAQLAFDMFVYRIVKYIGSYYVALGGLDCLVFTGGIGENSSEARAAIIKGLGCLGVELDENVNNNLPRGKNVEISTSQSKVKAVVIPTNEELTMARDVVRLLGK